METQAFNPKSLAKPGAKKSTKKAKPAALPKPPKLLQDELQRQAELIVAAYQLLADIEQRTESIRPGQWQWTIAEELLLRQAFPEDKTNHEIAARLANTRSFRELRRDCPSREDVEAARVEFHTAKAASAEAIADADVEDIGDVGGRGLVKHLRQLQAELDQLRETAAAAEQKFNQTRARYGALLRRAPKILRDRAEAARFHSDVPDIEARLQSSAEAVVGTRGWATRLEEYDPETDGNLAGANAVVASMCPEAVYDHQLTRLIDPEIVREHAAQLRDDLPALEQQERDIAVELENAKDNVSEPLHRWALAGELTVEMILE